MAAPSTTNSTPSASGSGSGCSLPPPGATFIRYCAKVSEKPESGRDSIQAWVPRQNGSTEVTMSLMTDFGITT